jgi:hypothetical protein
MAWASSERLRRSGSPDSGSRAWISTEASDPSDRREIFSMLAPSAARVEAMAWMLLAPSAGPMAVITYIWPWGRPLSMGLSVTGLNSSSIPSSLAANSSSLSTSRERGSPTSRHSVSCSCTTTCSMS